MKSFIHMFFIIFCMSILSFGQTNVISNGGFENLSGEKLRDFMMQQKPMGRPGKKSKGVSDNDRILDTLRDNRLDV